MTHPTCWYELRFHGDNGPLPKFYTFDDAEAAAWLLWDKAGRTRDVEVLEVDQASRMHIYTVPPPEEGRA